MRQSFARTVFFESCRGVFQGGGCRAAALAGAFEAASDHGVNFSAVAGTSAGSIIAALIGAGASPARVVEIVRHLDYMRFMADPITQDGYEAIVAKVVNKLFGRSSSVLRRSIARFIRFGGLYSSSQIETWMNQELESLLPNAGRPVRFADLLIPTSVVAANLASSNKVRVWSSIETPDEPVAFAVRSSCSIPIFFQAVPHGNGRYVDGGVISNLPAFVFSMQDKMRPASFADPILAFRLTENDVSISNWGPGLLASRLVNAIVDGATELQLGLTGNVQSIRIPTHGVSATDFARINSETIEALLRSGRTATSKFFSAEAMQFSNLREASPQCMDVYETYHAVAQEGLTAPQRVTVSLPNTDWAWKLFPSLLHWARSGSTINVVTEPIASTNKAKSQEPPRRQLLKSLGATLTEVTELPARGFVFNRAGEHSSAIILSEEADEYSPFAMCYLGAAHQSAVRAINTSLAPLIPPDSGRQRLSPTLVPADVSEFIGLLRQGVKQYRDAGVAIAVERVRLQEVSLIVSSLRAYKFRQIHTLAEMYQSAGLQCFVPAALQLQDSNRSLVTPPVLERHGNLLVAIEGNTRLFYCWRSGMTEVDCLVATGVRHQLPGRPLPIARVLLRSTFVPVEQRIDGFDYDRFRRIEGAIHQPSAVASYER